MRPVRRADNPTTTFMCRTALKSGSLNLLEPSGPVQACNGIALPINSDTGITPVEITKWNRCSHKITEFRPQNILTKQFTYTHNIVCIEQQSLLKIPNLSNIPVK